MDCDWACGGEANYAAKILCNNSKILFSARYVS